MKILVILRVTAIAVNRGQPGSRSGVGLSVWDMLMNYGRMGAGGVIGPLDAAHTTSGVVPLLAE